MTDVSLPAPTPDQLSEPFWSALAERRVMVQECPACGRRRFQRLPSCPYCAAEGGIDVEARGHRRRVLVRADAQGAHPGHGRRGAVLRGHRSTSTAAAASSPGSSRPRPSRSAWPSPRSSSTTTAGPNCASPPPDRRPLSGLGPNVLGGRASTGYRLSTVRDRPMPGGAPDQAEREQSGMTARYRTVRRLAVVVAVAMLAPLLVTVAGPASPAAAVTPNPIPGWPLGHQPRRRRRPDSYLALDGECLATLPSVISTISTRRPTALLTVTQSANLISFSVGADSRLGRLGMRDAYGISSDGRPVPPECHPLPFIDLRVPASRISIWILRSCPVDHSPGWFTVDSIAFRSGALTQLTVRFGQSCNGGLRRASGR